MKPYKLTSIFAIAAMVPACFAGEPSVTGCRNNDDCDGGSVCRDGDCIEICETQEDCPRPMVCSPAGLCVDAADGETPMINAVVGNGESGEILDGVVITGEYLASAAFELQRDGSPAMPLESRSQRDRQVEVILPADIRSGRYTLVATNQAGADQETIELLLPEVTGQQVLDKLNNDSVTGQLDPALIPATAGGGGNYLVNGDLTLGLDGWTTLSGTSGSLELVASAGVAGDYAVSNPSGEIIYGVSETIIPANHNRTYQVDADFRQILMSNYGTARLAVRALDEAGSDITSGGEFWYESAELSISDADWHHVSLTFGGGTDHELPAEARQIGVAFVLNDNGGVAGDRVYHVQGFGLFAIAAAGGIADGSVTPAKLSQTYAGAATAGGPAADLACSNCVSAAEVQFNYAASATPNGSASGLLCSNCVSSGEIVDGTITASDIGAGAVANSELANNAVNSAKIADNTITYHDIGANAVASSELANDAVNSAKIADNTITYADIGANAVRTGEILDGTITASDIGANAVNTSELANGAVTNAKLNLSTSDHADDCVTFSGMGPFWSGYREKTFCALIKTNGSDCEVQRGTGTWAGHWRIGVQDAGSCCMACF